jgi:hypothetical protein
MSLRHQEVEVIPGAMTRPKTAHTVPLMQRNPQYQSAAQIGAALGITRRFVHSLARRRAIPSLRLGHRTVLFDVEKVKAALAKLERKEVGQ